MLLAINQLGASAFCEVVLNEVLYDPEGPDDGAEFVELYNAGPRTYPLAGVRLEFVNGAVGPPWQLRWVGGEADSIQAGAFFLIVDRGWNGTPPGDAVVNLDLQNGPDGLRLLLPDGQEDRLGYGALTDTTLYELEPHPDAGSGMSLGRRPDGHDTNHNARDWAIIESPNPGRPNFQRFAAEIDQYLCSPPSLPAPGHSVEFTLHVINAGLDALASGPVNLVESTTSLRKQGWLDALEPGQGRWLQFPWQPGLEGLFRLHLEIPATDDHDALILPAFSYHVGLSPLYLSEVMAAPTNDACEWIEVANATDHSLDLGQFCLRDEDGDWRFLPARELEGGQWLVLVQNRTKFVAWWEKLLAAGARPPCEARSPVELSTELSGSWISLNNSAPATRAFADRVYLADSDGVVRDHVTLGADGDEVPAGRSWERVAPVPRGTLQRNWGPATTSLGGTPACRNSLSRLAEPTTRFDVHPNPFCPNEVNREGALHIEFILSQAEDSWDLLVYDLWGRQVRDLGGDRLGPGPRDVIWDGRDDKGEWVSLGAYIVLLRTYDRAEQTVSSRKLLALVDGGAR